MIRTAVKLLTAAALVMISVIPAAAGRLALSYLPPDFPPTDICRAPAEQVAPDETEVIEADAGGAEADKTEEWVSFLNRDVRTLSHLDADRYFSFISQLIDFKAELDERFSSADKAFAIIDLHVAAGRFEELEDKGLIPALADMSDALSQSERVRLARYFLTGTGVAADPERGEAMLTTEAYSGNANALLEVLRLQLAGVQPADWFEPPERTATLAFGGKLGQLNRGLCARAEFIARAYIDGDLLEPNPELAFAWRKFAADQGGRDAAWRVVEHMLTSEDAVYDQDDILHYLRLATDDAYLIDSTDIDALRETGALRADDIAETLLQMHGRTGAGSTRPSMGHFDMPVAVDDEGIGVTSPYLSYLKEITTFADVPGVIWTDLADEIILRKGRWAGEAEARDALTKAVSAGDPEANVKLAEMLLRDSATSGDGSASEDLLYEAVDRYGYAEAQRSLDSYFRCTAPDEPLESVANRWSGVAQATSALSLSVDDQDYSALDARTAPELVALLHRRAVAGHSVEMSGYLRRLESDPTVPESSLRYWAERVGSSKKALELYAIGAFELAETPEDASVAADFARRAQLSVGPAMALDLAIILLENSGRRVETADEVRRLLTEAGLRGEGAAIRLLQRLDGNDGRHFYSEFAEVIDARGDFLALMFASRHVDDATFDDYMARARSVMNCGTKDVSELADAYAARNRMDEAMHWLRVGLAIEGGHSMSRLGIAFHKMQMFDNPLQAETARTERNVLADWKLAYHRLSRPRSTTFDRAAAAGLLADAFVAESRDIRLWAFRTYAEAEPGIRRMLVRNHDVTTLLREAARTGAPDAQYALGLQLRDRSRDAADLGEAIVWLSRAAKGGHAGAMVDYAAMLAHGVGARKDPRLALIWLRKAEALSEPRAEPLARMVIATMEQG